MLFNEEWIYDCYCWVACFENSPNLISCVNVSVFLRIGLHVSLEKMKEHICLNYLCNATLIWLYFHYFVCVYSLKGHFMWWKHIMKSLGLKARDWDVTWNEKSKQNHHNGHVINALPPSPGWFKTFFQIACLWSSHSVI